MSVKTFNSEENEEKLSIRDQIGSLYISNSCHSQLSKNEHRKDFNMNVNKVSNHDSSELNVKGSKLQNGNSLKNRKYITKSIRNNIRKENRKV